MSGERRGSVTLLLQDAPEYYSPPSPSECPEPEDDCWDDIRPRPRRAQKKVVKKSEEDSAADTKKEKDTAQKSSQPKTATPSAIPSKVSGDAAKKADAQKADAQKGDANVGNVLLKKKVAKDFKKQLENKGAAKDEEEEEPEPPKPVFMHGCSAAYQRAVEHVRGPSAVPSIVVLGLPESEQPEEVNVPIPSQMDRSSFVAMAASKLKLKGAQTEDKQSNSESNLLSAQDLRKGYKPRPGKKFFEDAYISTWSQSILPTDESLFAITFNAREKPPLRTRTKSRLRLPRVESSEMDTSEWSDWRSVHDRVDQWLKDNARAEPDESHILAILQDLDAKKGILFR